MAKFFPSNSKRVGNQGADNFYIRQGEQLVRSRVVTRTNPRTDNQMLQRCKFSNVVNFWAYSQSAYLRGFLTKKKTQTWYNAFTQLNLNTEGIYLPKNYVTEKACVVAPYSISRGILPQITLNKGYDQNSLLTNIKAPEELNTIGNLSRYIIANNGSWQNGDKLCFIKFHQRFNYGNYPFMEVELFSMVLDTFSSDDTPEWLISDYTLLGGSSCLGIDLGELEESVYGVAFVHTRRTKSKVECSSQHVYMINDWYLFWQGPEAQERAIATYDANGNVYYDPNEGIVIDGPTTFDNWAIELRSNPNVSGDVISKMQEPYSFFLENNRYYYLKVNGEHLDRIVKIKLYYSTTLYLEFEPAQQGTDTHLYYILQAFVASGSTIKANKIGFLTQSGYEKQFDLDFSLEPIVDDWLIAEDEESNVVSSKDDPEQITLLGSERYYCKLSGLHLLNLKKVKFQCQSKQLLLSATSSTTDTLWRGFEITTTAPGKILYIVAIKEDDEEILIHQFE